MPDSRKRHLAKTLTWRIIGTLDTFFLAWIISGNPFTGVKIGAAEVVTKMILYYFHERTWYKINFGLDRKAERNRRMAQARNEEKHIKPHQFKIATQDRQRLLDQQPMVVWFTGLSGSGKSTLSNLLEAELHQRGFKTYTLDGDNVREGLCRDLSFTQDDRAENIRRIGEVSKLFLDAGLIVLCSFVSPFSRDRELAKQLIGQHSFIEVFVDCPLDVCEQRDVKGLYKKARSGAIKEFTGITSPFEEPKAADVVIKTAEEEAQDSLQKLIAFVLPKVSKLTHAKI